MVVFKNPRDASQMSHLARQIYPGRVKFVKEAFNDATSVQYGYLLVDLKQETPEDIRLRATISPDTFSTCTCRIYKKDPVHGSSLYSHDV